jgi:1,4-dihydroxy-6-naphthoate synthase
VSGWEYELVRKSLEFAFKNYPVITDYVKQHSQEMSEEVMRQHIDLYVNNYSLDLGTEGKLAIENLHQVFLELNNKEADDENLLFL